MAGALLRCSHLPRGGKGAGGREGAGAEHSPRGPGGGPGWKAARSLSPITAVTGRVRLCPRPQRPRKGAANTQPIPEERGRGGFASGWYRHIFSRNKGSNRAASDEERQRGEAGRARWVRRCGASPHALLAAPSLGRPGPPQDRSPRPLARLPGPPP